MIFICAIAILCCCIMAYVDGVLQPGYANKSAIKQFLFLFLPLLYAAWNRELLFRELFHFQRKGFLTALLLGGGIYVLIVGAYALLHDVFDFSQIAASLTESTGVNRSNFLFVALYISFINSMLEEFFFRGFIFMNLKKLGYRRSAYLFSALVFAMYHVAMMIGWFDIWLFLLVMLGLFVSGLIFNNMNPVRPIKFDRKSRTTNGRKVSINYAYCLTV